MLKIKHELLLWSILALDGLESLKTIVTLITETFSKSFKHFTNATGAYPAELRGGGTPNLMNENKAMSEKKN